MIITGTKEITIGSDIRIEGKRIPKDDNMVGKTLQ